MSSRHSHLLPQAPRTLALGWWHSEWVMSEVINAAAHNLLPSLPAPALGCSLWPKHNHVRHQVGQRCSRHWWNGGHRLSKSNHVKTHVTPHELRVAQSHARTHQLHDGLEASQVCASQDEAKMGLFMGTIPCTKGGQQTIRWLREGARPHGERGLLHVHRQRDSDRRC